MSLLELREITKDFPGVKALQGVSLTLEPAEVHALCGENGAGKSTLIKVLCGVYPAGTFGGQILLDGQPAVFHNMRAAEARGIALIAQELALVPELSVAENLTLGREPVRAGLIQWDEVRRQTASALAVVGLDVDPDRPVKELGIGQQQLVESAKALSKEARILVLDEPTAALTEADAQRLLRLLVELRARGVSSIYISHRLEEVFQIADRVTVLRDGRTVGTRKVAETNRDDLIRMMVGRELGESIPKRPAPVGEPILGVRGLTRVGAFEDVSFTVRAGEIVGIGGLVGAGRTEVARAIFGADPVDSGEILLSGRPIRPRG